jgi:hypothetical protein
MSVKSIEASTLSLQQINDKNGNPSITISPDGIVSLVSDAQSTATDANAISTIAYVNTQIADASVALNPSGSYRWNGGYNIFENAALGLGGSGLPTTIPTNGTSIATGMMVGINAGSINETDLYNFSNTGVGGFNFYNISATSPLTNYAYLGPNEGIPVFNLKGTGGQYQINGVNILNNVITTSTLVNYALINSPTFTGVPKAPTALSGNNSTQLATTAFVQSALSSTGSFSPNTPYTWGSSYQLFGNDQVVCVGSSLMNTNKPQTGATSPQQGSQICNNTQTLGETDFVNYSGASQGGFCFQQMSSTNALTTLGTLYRSGAASIFNLPNASSQFQINGTSIARQFTPTYSTRTVPTLNTVPDSMGLYSTTYSSPPTNSTSTINGVTTVNIGVPLVGSTPSPYTTMITQIAYIPTLEAPQNTSYCIISQLYGPAPTNPSTVNFNVRMINTNGTTVDGYGALLQSTASPYNWFIIFSATNNGINFNLTSSYIVYPFQFSYQ